jgi:hypothetical protein
MIRSFLYGFERWVVVCGEEVCRLEGKVSMVGGNPSLWTSYGRHGRMGEWKVQVMLPVPNQFGRHARG